LNDVLSVFCLFVLFFASSNAILLFLNFHCVYSNLTEEANHVAAKISSNNNNKNNNNDKFNNNNNTHTHCTIKANRPDIIIKDRRKKECLLIDVFPSEKNTSTKQF